MTDSRRNRPGSCLLELDQRSAEILRVEKQHWFVMRAKPWLAVAEHPCAFGAEPVARGHDVVDLIADVVNSARRIALEKTAHGEAVPSGSRSSILVFGNSTNTTLTPCTGSAPGSDTRAAST